MTTGSLILAMTILQTKRAVKNPYMLLWLGTVAISVIVASGNWLPTMPSGFLGGALNSVNYGVMGACLLLPLVVRSFTPAFAATGGVEFLAGRTDYLGQDVAVTLLVNMAMLFLTGMLGMMLAAYWLKLSISAGELLLPTVLTVLPSMLLLIAIILILSAVLPSLLSAVLFWLVVAGLCLVPGLTPWNELFILSNANNITYTPLMLVNRLFCLLAAGLLLYIYTQLLKNQSTGLNTTRLRREQAHTAEERAVIIAGKGLVLGTILGWERLKKEFQIMGYLRLLLGWLGAGACGWLVRTYEIAGIAGMGIVILWTTVILAPRNFDDYLLPGFQRRRWSFVVLRTLITLLLACSLILIFGLVGSVELANRLFWGFFVVWGVSWLGAHYWSLMTVRALASLFWMAMVFFPGALDMTVSAYWWTAAGVLLIMVAIMLYRRNLYPE